MSALAEAIPYGAFAAYCALLVAAAVCDVRSFTIPNRISLALAGLFLATAPFWPAPVPWLSHAGAAAIALAIGMGFFALGWLGGGDAKLISAIALWIGFERLPAFLVSMGLVGGVVALGLVAYRGLLRRRWVRSESQALPAVLAAGGNIPYALAIAPAGILVGSELPALDWPWL